MKSATLAVAICQMRRALIGCEKININKNNNNKSYDNNIKHKAFSIKSFSAF